MTLPPLQVAQTRGGRLGYIVSGAGRPHIVLVNGSGMSLEGWGELYPEIESLGTVFAWNRFGVKASDAPEQTQTGARVAATLRELLGYAGLEPPYVLVGHSLGCVHAELYARLHPADVAAILLVEPTFPDDPQALVDREDEFVRGTSKAQGVPAAMVADNLHSELAVLDTTLEQLEQAGARPPVPRRVLRSGGHFPQLRQPEMVLDALRALLGSAPLTLAG